MHSTTPHDQHWPPVGAGLWHRWWGYLARWLLFGLAVSVFVPVADAPEPWWQLKLAQAMVGSLFGLGCAVLFTLAENTFNTPRVAWKSWAIVGVSWLVVKVLFVSVLAIVG
jgi:hypothetical protein